MPTAWNMFVKKVYEEGKAKDSKYEFKQALVDASKRKGEMGSTPSTVKTRKTAKRGKKASKSMGKTRKRHSRRHKR